MQLRPFFFVEVGFLTKRENYIPRTLGRYPEELLVQADEHALGIGPEILGMRSGAIRRLAVVADFDDFERASKGFGRDH